ncbi:hypothetical protein DL762_005080 [Monosporascus cannonballus]|uniref:Mediator of RNA polymerase II transcription subunit 14 n=1 Tax=Monosporascus cannonballus TaxID=155416 RepID=A0ABY0H5X0_9PEZI|nr:hypothetical protein DL762_005080 [Monosporascus cannonballus]RYO92101.1 hypothetical protein DL763_004793 [Monosporascus cannonballus]
MENGLRNGLHTNHDRNGDRDHVQLANGSAGGDGKPVINGDVAMNQLQQANSAPGASRMNDLPDEIQHITQGYIPLSVLISRLAQRTHNALQERITALARIHVPGAAPAINGNSAHAGGLPDDVSPENLTKKTQLLNFIQETHARWVKVLVIAAWSRKVEPVSKLVDLMAHINQQRKLYDDGLDYMINLKRDLTFARLPNPDIKTALQILSTGDAPWMPDLGYTEAPPLSPKEQLQWIENLNTQLSLRMNLEEHDKIPYHFQDYSIESGRVTFRVPGEFEVDLTIADEDFEKQFWFVDFRFLFEPAPAELSDMMRMFLDQKVNEVLEKEGLQGCYNFLHEFVLTHKITEYVRQAFELRRGRWVDTLKVERLNRAMAIQYWVDRYPPEAPKSWIILGVHSGKKPGVTVDPSSTSHLTLRWFKDNKEMKNVAIPLDDATVSTERLLKKVVGKHIEYILTTIYSRLKVKGRFVNREASLGLTVSEENPEESALKMQLGYDDYVTVRIAPTTGLFAMAPQTNVTWNGERQLNSQARDPAEEGMRCLEIVRCHYFVDAMNRRGGSLGWTRCKIPVKMEDLKPILNTRETFQTVWFRRRGWTEQWHLMLSLSLSGDRWWLMEVTQEPTRITSFTQLPLSPGSPNLSDKFFVNLTVFAAAMISHITDLKALHDRKIQYTTGDTPSYSLPPSIRIPSVFVRLSDILQKDQSPGSKKKAMSWAIDFVQIMFDGIQNSSSSSQSGSPETRSGGAGTEECHRLSTLVDARFKVADPERFSLLKGNVERDVAFNKRLGVFALRLRAEVGHTILDTLAQRLRAIERLVDCIDAIRRSDRDVRCEDITLNRVTFTYSDRPKANDGATMQQDVERWKASLVLRKGEVKLELERGNPHLRIIDLFNRLVNSELRFHKLPFFLSSTLPVIRAFDLIEEAWKDIIMRGAGRVEVFPAHLNWFNIRYTLPGPNRGAERRLTLGIKLRFHRGAPMWHIERAQPGVAKHADDVFKKALDRVWNAEGKVWNNLIYSAAVAIDNGIEALLKAVDEAIRPLVTQSPLMTRQAAPRAQQPQPQPQHHQQQQQQQRSQNQNHAPNHKMMAAMAAASKARQHPQQLGQGQVVILDD